MQGSNSTIYLMRAQDCSSTKTMRPLTYEYAEHGGVSNRHGTSTANDVAAENESRYIAQDRLLGRCNRSQFSMLRTLPRDQFMGGASYP